VLVMPLMTRVAHRCERRESSRRPLKGWSDYERVRHGVAS
jgi:hypothetical protein